MGEHRRKADGRRVFSTEFKRQAVQRILSGEKTVAELSRELDIYPSVIRTWKRFAEAGATPAVQASEDVVPTSQLREAYAKIRERERALGRKTMEVEILRAAQEIVKKRRRCAESPHGDPFAPHRDLPDAAHGAPDGLLRGSGPPRRSVSPDERSGGPGADPRGDEPPRDLRLPSGVGDGEPDLPGGLQPQAHSAGDATQRRAAGAPGAPAPWAAAPRADPPAGVEPALVFRRLRAALLERGGPLGGLRDRLSRPRGVRLDGLTPPADGGGHSHADGQGPLGALWRGHAQGPARNPMALGQWPPIHGHGLGALRARARPGADHDTGVQPREQRARRGLCGDVQAGLRGRRRAPGCRVRPGAARSLDRGLQHPGAALGARDAEPGRVPSGGHSKLLAVSSPLGSTPRPGPAFWTTG